MTKVFVGNLSWGTTDDSLRSAFSTYGNVTDAVVLRDRETGRSRGFGFVTFDKSEDANNAITGLNDQELDGRNVRVNLANERPAGGSGFGGGNRGGYGGGYGGNRGGYGGNQGGYGGGYNQGGYGGNQGGYQQGGY